MGKFEILVTKGDADPWCKSSSGILFLEYVGFDPIYPHLKVICDRLQNLRTNEDSAASPRTGLGSLSISTGHSGRHNTNCAAHTAPQGRER